MKRKLKKGIAILLAFAMLFSLVPTAAFADTAINTINIKGITAPVAGKSPVTDGITTDTTGVTLKTIQWEKTDGVIMTSSDTFEAGKTYECVLQVEPMAGYAFPENKDDFSGKINGIQGVVSPNYSTSKAYVTVQFSFTTYGDADGNTKVDAADALKALQHTVNLITLEGESYTAANVNGDDEVNATDALLMLQYTVKLIEQFPVEQ